MISYSVIDAFIILLYLVGVLFLGIWRSRAGAEGAEDYLVAGRRITLPAFVASLVSTWYGGILGVGEFSYLYGISNWLVFGVPYYLYAIIFALFLAARARRTRQYTIPDQLYRIYGKPTSLAGAVFIFIASLPAPYMLMLGILLQLLFPLPLWLCILLSGAFSLLYIYRTGLSAVVRTDVLQFILMFAGFILLVGVAGAKFGGYTFLKSNLPATHWQWNGGHRVQYILVWYLIAMATLIDPNFYQRCYGAKTEKTAKWGILISILFWIAFDFLTTTAGLYARALLPDLQTPAESYPRLAVFLLPAVARGLFFVALLATIMSTLDSFFFVSAVTIGRDFWGRIGQGSQERQLTRLTRIGLLISFVISVALAILVKSVIEMWYQLGSIATPALLLPLAASFSKRWRMRPRWAFFSISASGGISFLWLLTGTAGHSYWLGIEPIYPGFIVSIFIFLSNHLLERPFRGSC